MLKRLIWTYVSVNACGVAAVLGAEPPETRRVAFDAADGMRLAADFLPATREPAHTGSDGRSAARSRQ